MTLQRGFDLPRQARRLGTVPVVSSSGISGTHDTVAVSAPGVVTGRYGTIGEVYWIDEPFWPLNTALFVKDYHGNDPSYCYYLLKTIDFDSVSDKSGVPGVNRNDLHDFSVDFVACLDQQRAIASSLGALDGKILVNRRIGKALERMARALFKSWFVDFDPVTAQREGREIFGLEHEATLYPSHFQESELGPIPHGWQVLPLRQIVNLLRESVNPQDSVFETFAHYSIPAYDDRRCAICELGRGIQSNKYAVPDDVILISKLNPDTPRVWWPDDSAMLRRICSTEFLVCQPRIPFSREYIFEIFSSADFLTEMVSLITGTSNSHQRVKPDDFLDIRIVAPPREIVERFTDIVRPWLELARSHARESVTLASLRDTLLPKLLSGECRLNHDAKL